MGELRKDYVLDRWVIVSPERGNRPHVFKHKVQSSGTCVFCPENEAIAGETLGSVLEGGKWKIRWLENKYPAVSQTPSTAVSQKLYDAAPASGYHEVIVETRDHDKQLADCSPAELASVLSVYAQRVAELSKRPDIKYVSIFKNHGFLSGASVAHSHSQVVATAFVPSSIKEKVSAVRKFLQCPYCSVIESEKTSGRFIAENDAAIAFCPFASRFNYEAWVFPKHHVTSLGELDMESVADVLSKVLKKVGASEFDYTMTVQHGPDLHAHIEVCPRISFWGGYEFGSGVVINQVSPEDAARFYRE